MPILEGVFSCDCNLLQACCAARSNCVQPLDISLKKPRIAWQSVNGPKVLEKVGGKCSVCVCVWGGVLTLGAGNLGSKDGSSIRPLRNLSSPLLPCVQSMHWCEQAGI